MGKHKFMIWCEEHNIMVKTVIEAEDEFEAYEQASTNVIRGVGRPDDSFKIEYLGEVK
jgi:hypothetical protein